MTTVFKTRTFLTSAFTIGLLRLWALSAFIGLSFGVQAQVYPSSQPPGISVTGEAEIQVMPDEVIITLGVESKSAQLQNAKSENDQRVNAVIAALKKAGVKESAIQTDFFSVNPEYRSADTTQPESYTVRKRMMVTLSDIDAFERVISGALRAGANVIQGIDFRTSALREHRDKARSLALKAAQEKASAMAVELGQTIGRPLQIIEQRGGYWSYYSGGWWGGHNYGGMSQNVMQSAGGSAEGAGTLAPGKIKISASVSATFELLQSGN